MLWQHDLLLYPSWHHCREEVIELIIYARLWNTLTVMEANGNHNARSIEKSIQQIQCTVFNCDKHMPVGLDSLLIMHLSTIIGGMTTHLMEQ